MPVLRYYNGSTFVDLPGLPGAQGPTGSPGAAGPGGAAPAYVAQAWGPAATTTGTGPLSMTATALKAGRNYLVVGYATGSNVSGAAATIRVGVSIAGSGGTVGPNVGAWICYEANLAADQTPTGGAFFDGCSASFVFTPSVDGDQGFTIFSVGTASACQFTANSCAIYVIDLSGTIGPAGPAGPTGPPGGGSTIVSVRAWRQTAYNLPVGSGNAFVYDTKQWDTQNAFNASTGTFTAPVTGKYKLFAQIAFQATAANQYAYIIVNKNGSQVTNSYSAPSTASGQWDFVQAEDTLDLVVNDTITFTAAAPTGQIATYVSQTNTYLTIDLLSGTGPQGPAGPVGPAGSATDMYKLTYVQTVNQLQPGSPYTLVHGLGTKNLLVEVWDSVTQQLVNVQVQTYDINTIILSVAAAAPNPLNVVVMGIANSIYPVQASDVASKGYVDARTPNLPAPVASGATVQSFTDALGDVWVAKNGVRGGVWMRARDVVGARAFPNATQATTAGTYTIVPYNSTNSPGFDPLGMLSGNSLVMPVAGRYAVSGSFSYNSSPAALGQLQPVLYLNGAGTFWGETIYFGASQVTWPAVVYTDVLTLNANDTIALYAWAGSTAGTIIGNSQRCSFSAQYLGTG